MTGRLLTRLFALFGMTLTCVACYGVVHTEFNPDFGAAGRVVDDENNPIVGIRAQCGTNTVYTDESGRFHVRSTTTRIVLTDVDGEENGGEFETLELNISDKVVKVKEGDGRWYQGEYAADLGDVTMILKAENVEQE